METKELNLEDLVQDRDVRGDCDVRDLEESIKEVGLLHPVVVTARQDGKYTVLAGNRRLHACRKLGWTSIPVTVFEADGKDKLLRARSPRSTRTCGARACRSRSKRRSWLVSRRRTRNSTRARSTAVAKQSTTRGRVARMATWRPSRNASRRWSEGRVASRSGRRSGTP